MSTPVLFVLAGPNGSGKSTFVARVLQPATHLPFINADEIAKEVWPGAEELHAYEASAAAASAREQAFAQHASFITETVFSHESKVHLVKRAYVLGYLVRLRVMLVPEDLTVARVQQRISMGGHTVPEHKIRERYHRLWRLVAEARTVADETIFFDNSSARNPFMQVAEFSRGHVVGKAAWPPWTPDELR